MMVLLALNLLVLEASAQISDVPDEEGFSVEQGRTEIENTGYDSPFDPISHKNASILPEHRHNKKFQSVKHIDLKVVVPQLVFPAAYVYYDEVVNTPVLPDSYQYLYYREINPPPPKA